MKLKEQNLWLQKSNLIEDGRIQELLSRALELMCLTAISLSTNLAAAINSNKLEEKLLSVWHSPICSLIDSVNWWIWAQHCYIQTSIKHIHSKCSRASDRTRKYLPLERTWDQRQDCTPSRIISRAIWSRFEESVRWKNVLTLQFNIFPKEKHVWCNSKFLLLLHAL